MGRPRKLTPGQRFGRLVFEKYSEEKDGNGNRVLVFLCDCGLRRHTVNASGRRLKNAACLDCLREDRERRKTDPELRTAMLASSRAASAARIQEVDEWLRKRAEAAKDPAEREAWLSAVGARDYEGRQLRAKLRRIYGATP